MTIAVRRLGPEDWQEWHDVRLAALAGAPEAYERHGFCATGQTRPHPRDPGVIEHLKSRG
ncbi:hypothetical protein AB0M46_12345 [Dactylosporangium sp. NPDC051485]|uniref:hypothetical protein n=1 Tax=Dactylosporangium sp. NPDC051485 TaxID=3154846 RepID=UPI00343A09CD